MVPTLVADTHGLQQPENPSHPLQRCPPYCALKRLKSDRVFPTGPIVSKTKQPTTFDEE